MLNVRSTSRVRWRWVRSAMLAVALLVGATAAARAAEPVIEVYTRPGCSHCADAHVFLAELARERPALAVVEHDVIRSPDALGELRELSARAGIATPGVPTFVIGDHVVVGFDPETTPARIRALLAGGGPGPGEPAPRPELPQGSIDLPFAGLVNAQELGLPAFTVVVGLIDGLNPCATWVLLFLLAMLVHLKDRSRMALIAGTFVIVSGGVYYAFMAAWLTFFTAIGISQPVRILLALLALVIGAVHLNDSLAWIRAPSLHIPQSAKPGLYRRVREILRAENLTGAMTGIVALAFLVNLVELLCTAGLPALYTAILTRQELPAGGYYAYLALYIAAYMLDDAVLVSLGVVTLSQRKLQERGGRALELVSGLAILSLGVLLLLRPAWLGM